MNTPGIQTYVGRWHEGCGVKTYDGQHQCWLRYHGRMAQIAPAKNVELDWVGNVPPDAWQDVGKMPTAAEDVTLATPDAHAPHAVANAIRLGLI